MMPTQIPPVPKNCSYWQPIASASQGSKVSQQKLTFLHDDLSRCSQEALAVLTEVRGLVVALHQWHKRKRNHHEHTSLFPSARCSTKVQILYS